MIALISVIGTLIPQRDDAAPFIQSLSPGLLSFLQMMQIFDLYHSVWFFLIMGLLSLNLIICSLNRFPASWRRFRAESSPDQRGIFNSMTPANMMRTKLDRETVTDQVYAAIKRKFRRMRKWEADGGIYIKAEKGRIAYMGVYIVHLSILVLIAGAVTGALFGLEGYVNISEGETVTAIDLRGGKGSRPLPFAVRCDRFTIDFYENGAPKTYRSDLTFLKNEQAVHQGSLLVNHPISFDGLRFYQASYGQAPEGKARVSFTKDKQEGQRVAVALGDAFDLPGQDGKVHVLRIEENLMKMGPAVKLSIRSPKGETVFWIFQHIDKIKEANPGIMQQVPLFNPGLFQPYTFTLMGLEEKYYTGLQVARDPGVPLVMAAGGFDDRGADAGFFYLTSTGLDSHRPAGREQTRLSITGKAHKNQSGLEREIKQMLADLRGRMGVDV